MNQLMRMMKFQSNAILKIGRNRVKLCSGWAKTHSQVLWRANNANEVHIIMEVILCMHNNTPSRPTI